MTTREEGGGRRDQTPEDWTRRMQRETRSSRGRTVVGSVLAVLAVAALIALGLSRALGGCL